MPIKQSSIECGVLVFNWILTGIGRECLKMPKDQIARTALTLKQNANEHKSQYYEHLASTRRISSDFCKVFVSNFWCVKKVWRRYATRIKKTWNNKKNVSNRRKLKKSERNENNCREANNNSWCWAHKIITIFQIISRKIVFCLFDIEITIGADYWIAADIWIWNVVCLCARVSVAKSTKISEHFYGLSTFFEFVTFFFAVRHLIVTKFSGI